MTIKGKCVLLGCLEETRDTLAYLTRLGEKPDHIVSITEEEARKQGATNYVDLSTIAVSLGIPFTHVNLYSMQDEQDGRLFEELNPGVLLVVGWQRLVPDSILQSVAIGSIGFHGSCNILPWGRGRSPINWSIIEGRNRFALHMFLLKPGVDDGDIIAIKVYDINESDTCRSVYYKTALAQAELLANSLPSLRSGECSVMSQRGRQFHYPKRTPADGRIDWTQDAMQICRLIRAVTWPYPGAFSLLGNKEVRIWEAAPFSYDFFEDAQPGTVCFVPENGTGEFVVRAADGTVLITKSEGSEQVEVGKCLE
ncbi:methionyl-tRNA formyltransferase [Desulforhopalus sp. 52FAK]